MSRGISKEATLRMIERRSIEIAESLKQSQNIDPDLVDDDDDDDEYWDDDDEDDEDE